MEPKVSDPGVSVPPADSTVPPAAAGSEPVKTPETPAEQTVPYTRFQEVNDRAKQAEEELQRLRDEQSQSRTPNDDEVDPDVVELVKKSAGKLGFVTQAELNQREMDIQVKQDVRDLEGKYSATSVPYQHQAIMDYAKTNNMPITSKAALEAAYRSMNWDKLMEVERQKTLDAASAGGNGGAERPGAGGGQPPSESEITGKNPRDRVRERIRLARAK